jgi:hypothetical protein
MNYHPGRAIKDSSISTRIYFGLIAFMITVKVVFILFPTVFPGADQEGAFFWTTILAIAVMGFIGLILTRRTGFPDIWDPKISQRQRFLIPTVIGLVYGLITVIEDLRSPSPVHLKLPLSIPFYAYGAILLEIMLRLFAITFLVWLFSNVLLRGRWQTQVFWIAAIIAALYEPLPFIKADLAGVSGLGVATVLLAWTIQPLFLANVITGWLFRKYGFLAALVMRLSFYLVWHIIYGGLISTAR